MQRREIHEQEDAALARQAVETGARQAHLVLGRLRPGDAQLGRPVALGKQAGQHAVQDTFNRACRANSVSSPSRP